MKEYSEVLRKQETARQQAKDDVKKKMDNIATVYATGTGKALE